MTPAEIEQAVARTSAQYMGDLQTMLVEVGKVYEGQLAAQQETIAELRRQRNEDREREREALAERANLRERLAQAEMARTHAAQGPESTEVPGAGDTTPGTYRPAQGLWQRLRRALGGE